VISNASGSPQQSHSILITSDKDDGTSNVSTLSCETGGANNQSRLATPQKGAVSDLRKCM